MQVQATRGTLLIVMIYFRDSGNFVRNQGVPPQSVALDLKKKLTRNDILSVRLYRYMRLGAGVQCFSPKGLPIMHT